jgi:hypothetical protein
MPSQNDPRANLELDRLEVIEEDMLQEDEEATFEDGNSRQQKKRENVICAEQRIILSETVLKTPTKGNYFRMIKYNTHYSCNCAISQRVLFVIIFKQIEFVFTGTQPTLLNLLLTTRWQ